MRWAAFVMTIALLAATGFAADQEFSQPQVDLDPIPPQGLSVLPCAEGTPSIPGCNPSKRELKEARAAFARAARLQRAHRTDEAFEEFEKAARLVPRNPSYVTARELARQQLVFDHLQQGNAALLQGDQTEAMADFRSALQLDPQNEFAQQRIRDTLGEWAPRVPSEPRVLRASAELRLVPNDVRADFHYRGNGRDLLTQVARAFGIAANFDDSFVARPVRFDVTNVDFYAAMRAACDVTHSFWTPIHEKQIFLAAESAENHRKFDRMALRTFYVPGLTQAADMTNLVNLMRTVFDIRLASPDLAAGTLTLRAPQGLLDAATQFLETLDSSRPEVMLDVKIYEISHTLMRNLGMQIPYDFKLFNIPAAALLALGGQNIQQLINQLISSGGINQANSQALSALLAQIQGQQNSIFSQPLATFGNGLTLMGLSLGTAGAQLGINESSVRHLQHVMLRVSQGNEATFRMGSRYPILNATFAPIFNSPQISQVIQNNSFQAAFPSFSYEDLGLSVKAKPAVSGTSAIGLHLEMQLRTLLGQSINGVPIISNREFNGTLTLMNGEPAVVAGALTHNELRSMTGIPGLGTVPGLNKVMTSNSLENDDDELLVVITPRITNLGTQQEATIWLPHE